MSVPIEWPQVYTWHDEKFLHAGHVFWKVTKLITETHLGGRGHLEYYLVQHPCSRQGQLEQIAQNCVKSDFEYLQGLRLHNLSG